VELLLAVSLWFFAVTHVDTLVALVAFCADESYRVVEVLLGHYVGFSVGLAAAILGALFTAEALQESAFLLGIVPLALGLAGFARRRPSSPRDGSQPASALTRTGTVATAGVGLSGENVAVFVPFFATLSPGELVVISLVYVCAAGAVFVIALVVARRSAAGLPDWTDRWLVPASLVVIGLYVLTTGWLAR